MARIAGINIPSNKKLSIALTYIYGIGPSSSCKICKKAKVDPGKRVFDLAEAEISQLREVINTDYMVEGDLRKKVAMDIKTLVDMKSYRGMRHIRRLPVRGQRTHTNARTRRGRALAIAGKKKAPGKK